MRVKLAMTFNSVTGIAMRASGDGKSLMKFIDDFIKRQKYYEKIDFETQDKIKALGHICKNLFRTGETMLDAILHEDNVRRKLDSVPKPPKLTQTEPPWLEWKQDFFDYLRTQVNYLDVPLLYVLVDKDFKVETDADQCW